jgi:hypothetical protein
MQRVESEPPFKDPRCTCPHGVASFGRLYGISMGRGWVRLEDGPDCPVHEYRPKRKRSAESSALRTLEELGIDPDAL